MGETIMEFLKPDYPGEDPDMSSKGQFKFKFYVTQRQAEFLQDQSGMELLDAIAKSVLHIHNSKNGFSFQVGAAMPRVWGKSPSVQFFGEIGGIYRYPNTGKVPPDWKEQVTKFVQKVLSVLDETIKQSER